MNYNKTLLLGRISSDLELRETHSGTAVCNFTLREKKRHGDKTEIHYYPHSAYGQLAEALVDRCAKGDFVFVEGELEMQKWYPGDGDGVRTKLGVTVKKFISWSE